MQLLQLDKVSVVYPGVKALDNVSFTIDEGQIVSLVGENGAGKSTLLKVISGVIPYTQYQGNVYVGLKHARYSTVTDSIKDRIAIVHQELATNPHLSVYENIHINEYVSKFGILNWNEIYRRTKKALAIVGLDDLDIKQPMGNLSIAKQQLVEIAKALSKDIRLLILDEPTSSLNDSDSQNLLRILKDLKIRKRLTVLFVSHKLNEVQDISDSIVVIRDGKFVSQKHAKTDQITEASLIKDIVGRSLESRFPPKVEIESGKVILEVKNLNVNHPFYRFRRLVKNVSFNLNKGEIIGFSGIVGSGRTELFMALFGKAYGSNISGEIYFNGQLADWSTTNAALKSKVFYASEDRKNLGLIQRFSILKNISLSAFHHFSRFGIVSSEQLVKNALDKRKELRIKVPSIDFPVSTLSGGNQQKVVLAKALSSLPEILILDEPTKGIDVGSKYEIYEIIFKLKELGKSIIVISSEIPELLGITDRIYVMANGRVKGVVDTNKATQEKIMELSLLNNQENVTQEREQNV